MSEIVTEELSSSKKNVSFLFLNSSFSPYIIPIIYFCIFLPIVLTNNKIGNYGVETDFFVAYAPQAKALLQGVIVIDAYRGPFYQICLAVISFFLGQDFFLGGKILNVIAGTIVLLSTYRLISSIYTKEGAFFVTLLVALNQIFWRYTYETGTDLLFFSIYITSLSFILRNNNFDNKNLFFAGILSGLAYLTRYTGISLFAFTFIVLTIEYYKTKKISTHSTPIFLKKFLYYFIPILILVSIWSFITYKNTGNLFYNMNYLNTAISIHKPDNISKDEWYAKESNNYNSMVDVVSKDPILFFKKIIIQNSFTYFTKDVRSLVPKYIGIFVILGLILFIFKIKSHPKLIKYYSLASLLFYLQILLIFYSERFTLPLLPFYFFLIISLFSYGFIQRFNFSLGRIKFFGIIIFLIMGFSFYTSFKVSKTEINSGPYEILKIKEWADDNYKDLLAGKSIMARKPHIAYFLDMNYTPTPFAEDYSSFLNNLKQSQSEFVFVSEQETAYLPSVELQKILLNYSSPPKDLEVITYTTNPTAILYKVK